MVSASKAKRLAKRAAVSSDTNQSTTSSNAGSIENGLSKLSVDDDGLLAHVARTCTGVLASLESSRDIRIDNFSLSSFGKVLISETTVELNFGRRYGLLGENGCGKSTFLKAIAAREVPIPEHSTL
jgi:ATP-binding cassette subfamily F protein 2